MNDASSTTGDPRPFSAIEPWIAERREPFSIGDAATACEHASLAGFAPRATPAAHLQKLAAFLAAHPSVACGNYQFHTPRTLAAKCRFVLRLLPSERERGVLIPGHRFIPFVPFPVDPDRLILQRADGSEVPRVGLIFSRRDAEMCFNYLGRRRDRYLSSGPSDDLVTVSGFRLASPGETDLPHEWVVSCRDFDRGLYTLSPMPAVSHASGAAAVKRLRRSLAEVIASPPPGPVDAVRQVLQVVARSLPDIAAHPIGPLGPILANAQECGLVEVDGVTMLTTAAQVRAMAAKVAVGSSPGGRAGDERPGGALPAEGPSVREFQSIEWALARISSALVSRSLSYDGRIRGLTWDPGRRQFLARVQGSDPRPYAVTLRMPAHSRRLDTSCSCPYSAGVADCKHIAAVLRFVIGRFGAPSLSGRVERAPVARPKPPAWRLALDRLDAVLKPGPNADPDRPVVPPQRVVWRLSQHERKLGITAVVQSCGKSGRWGKGRQRPVHRIYAEAGSWPLPADRSAAAILCLDGSGGWGYSYSYGGMPVSAVTAFRALSHLVGHPAVFWEEEPTRPVRVLRGNLRLRFETLPKGGMGIVAGFSSVGTPFSSSAPPAGEQVDGGRGQAPALRSADEDPLAIVDSDDIIACDDGCLLLDRDEPRIVVAPTSAAVRAVLEAFVLRPVAIPKEGAEELLSRLPLIEAVMPVDLPTELAGEEVPADRRVRILLTPDHDPGLGVKIGARPLGDASSLVVPGEGAVVLRVAKPDRRVFTRRDLDGEKARAGAISEALGLGRFESIGPQEWRIPDDEAALDFVDRLEHECPGSTGAPTPVGGTGVPPVAGGAGVPSAAGRTGFPACAAGGLEGLPPPGAEVVVEWPEEGRRLTLMRDLGVQALRVRIEDRKDWFGLDGEIALDGGSVRLMEVLEAMRRGRRYVPVGDGRWYRISDFLRERLSGIAYLARSDHREIEIGPASAPLVADLVKETGLLEATRAWREMFRRFEQAMALNPNPPAGLRGTLRDYQIEGYRWMSRLSAWGVGGCLADDMGLGKTVQALAVLADRADAGPALIVAPTSVGSNWIRETRRFFPGLNPVLYRETDRTAPVEAHRAGDLVVISYGLALRDAARLASVKWGTLVLDEAQFIKNSQTKTAQAIRRIPSDWRLALTGTPLENHLGELWSLFRGVSPGLFGSWERFREEFAQPIEAGKDANRRKVLSRMVRPFILRRTKGEVLRELPPKTEVRLAAELSPEERKIYDAARLAALARLSRPAVRSGALQRATGGAEAHSPPSDAEASHYKRPEDRRFEVLAALTELRQLACHPRLVYPDITLESAKMRVLMETIDELREEGHRALVFSQFVRHLALVRERLDGLKIAYQYLDGSTPPKERDRAVDLFQRGEGDLFLISLKAGGTGLNLTGADYVIHLDPWWNPAVEDQATDRAHRIGQSRSVMVYRIVSIGTIEEQILALHADKRDLVSGVLEGTDAAAKLSTEELIDLIRGKPEAAAASMARAQASGPP